MTDPVLFLADPDPASLGDTPIDMLRRLRKPAVITRAGRDRSRARGVSALLHGNEPSGLVALHAFLRSGEVPATDVVCTVGAVEAALQIPGMAHRYLPGRRDLNRCFAEPWDGEDGAIARSLLTHLVARPLEAAVDLHNNTGHNPAYGVLSLMDERQLRVVSYFADRAVLSGLHLGTLTDALSAHTVCATIECGRAGDRAADETGKAGLQRFLLADRLDAAPLPPMRLYVSAVRVKLAPQATVVFGDAPDDGFDLTLLDDVDRHNFEEMPVGTPIGYLRQGSDWPLVAETADGHEASRELFSLEGRAIVVRKPLVPIMMTTSVAAARQDCLCYLVEQPQHATGTGFPRRP